MLMRDATPILVTSIVAVALLVVPAVSAREGVPDQHELAITRLGNEGFALALDGVTTVLVDALYGDGIAGYETVPIDERRKLEHALPPYDQVRWVLASHVHGDHFDARAVAAYLIANPRARFLSTPQAVAQLRPIAAWPRFAERVDAAWPEIGERFQARHESVSVQAFRMHHGSGTDAQNLGLLVSLGGATVLHMGDTEASLLDMRSQRLSAEPIDVALVPSWYFLSDRWRPLLDSLHAGVRVVMHLAAPDAPPSYFGPAKSRAQQERRIRAADRGAVLLDQLATHVVAVPAAARKPDD